jgi:hypothetical protein
MTATSTAVAWAGDVFRKQLVRRDFSAWCSEALAPLNQTPARHHRLLIAHLEKVATGETDRLMVNMPPGSAKSTYSSVLWPAHLFARRPNFDIIGASHGSELAELFSGRIQGYVRQHDDMLGYRLESESVKAWTTTNGGNYRAAGVGGSITGRRADLIIIDDPVKGMQDAESETVRNSQWEWYQSEALTRLKKFGRIVIIQTRWSPDDLSGRLLQAQESGGDKWTVLRLPAIADSLEDPLGRRIGDPLWPEWQSLAELERLHSGMDAYTWGALYQQDPRPRGAMFFDLDSLLVSNDGALVPVPTPTRCDTVFACVDTAIKTGQKHDSTAVVYASYNTLTKLTTIILDWDIIQVEGAAQMQWLEGVYDRCEALASQCGARYGSSGAFIEDKATGTLLLGMEAANARRTGKAPRSHPIDSILTSAGKDGRALAAAPYLLGDKVKIAEPAYNKVKIHKGASRNHLLAQLSNFRLGAADGAADDLVDAFCYSVVITCGSRDAKGRAI